MIKIMTQGKNQGSKGSGFYKDYCVTWEERFAEEHLGEYAAEAPHVHARRVTLRGQQDLRRSGGANKNIKNCNIHNLLWRLFHSEGRL